MRLRCFDDGDLGCYDAFVVGAWCGRRGVRVDSQGP